LAAVVVTAAACPRLVSLEIRGFRAFGTEPRILQLDAPLVVVHAGNSQGKTSLTEAIEFLISGRSSRRELLGGAKAEYNDSLRNAHLPPGDTNVYVEASVRTGLRFRSRLRM
jgi:DNA repair exonuclease SbcCD ATPase subunit